MMCVDGKALFLVIYFQYFPHCMLPHLSIGHLQMVDAL